MRIDLCLQSLNFRFVSFLFKFLSFGFNHAKFFQQPHYSRNENIDTTVINVIKKVIKQSRFLIVISKSKSGRQQNFFHQISDCRKTKNRKEKRKNNRVNFLLSENSWNDDQITNIKRNNPCKEKGNSQNRTLQIVLSVEEIQWRNHSSKKIETPIDDLKPDDLFFFHRSSLLLIKIGLDEE